MRPVAIIGIGCRFPGDVTDLESFWRLLADGRDAIGPPPASRLDLERPVGASESLGMGQGGYLDGVECFDAAFFGLSRPETERIDPQQRLLLEVAWEALEDAGQDISALSGSRTGVFVGQWTSDYEARLFADPGTIDFNTINGTGRYAASGRISYLLGLRGPSMTVDSACSSSLGAVHLAMRSIQSGDSGLALAGGVNLILRPHIQTAYGQVGMMAADGRCRFGDARREGYVRSEGAGLVVLKALDAALADGDRIHAVIRGGALNSDGDSGGAMGRPSLVGHGEMLKAALEDAGLAAEQIGYVEAHGTGTRAGDRIEVSALSAALGPNRRSDRPLLLGSVKTNIGHCEAAAGVAGLIKAALVVGRGEIPASLHFDEPAPDIDWAGCAVAPALQPWPSQEGLRRAGVTAFGISGANCHMVVEEPPATESPRPRSAQSSQAALLPLSARSLEALLALAGRYADLLDQGADLGSVCWTAATRRAALVHRAVFAAPDSRAMASALRAYAAGDRATVSGEAGDGPADLACAEWLRDGRTDWSRAIAPSAVVDLPLYPWRRERYWIRPAMLATPKTAGGAAQGGARPETVSIEDLVRSALAQVLQIAPSGIDPDRPFGEMGLTSLRAVELRQVLEAALRTSLPATLAYNYPTIAALARELQAMTRPAASVPSGERSAAYESLTALGDDEVEALLIEELGMAGQGR